MGSGDKAGLMALDLSVALEVGLLRTKVYIYIFVPRAAACRVDLCSHTTDLGVKRRRQTQAQIPTGLP